MTIKRLKYLTNHALNDPNARVSKVINGFVSFLIIFSIAVIPLHFLPNVDWIADELFLFDRITVTIFTVEYVLRAWSAPKLSRYIFSWWGIIDLMAILPFYLARFGWLGIPEVFLLLRVLRILKFGRIYTLEELNYQIEHNPAQQSFKILQNEIVEQVVHKHAVIFLLGMILPLFFTTAGLVVMIFFQATNLAIGIAVLFFFFAAVFFAKAWLDYHYDVIYITNCRIIVQNRELFGAIANDISYESITNVIPNNIGIIRWLFGIGQIQIETAAFEGTLSFENAPKPHKVVQKISSNRQRILAARQSREARESAMLRDIQSQERKLERMVEEIEHRNGNGNNTPPTP